MPQIVHVFQCFACRTFQQSEVAQSQYSKFECKMCRSTQCVQKEFFNGTITDCRNYCMQRNNQRIESSGSFMDCTSPTLNVRERMNVSLKSELSFNSSQQQLQQQQQQLQSQSFTTNNQSSSLSSFLHNIPRDSSSMMDSDDEMVGGSTEMCKRKYNVVVTPHKEEREDRKRSRASAIQGGGPQRDIRAQFKFQQFQENNNAPQHNNNFNEKLSLNL